MPLELTRATQPDADSSRAVEGISTATVAPDPLLVQAAEDCVLLLDHCVRHERRVGREVLAQVTEGARAIRAGAIAPDTELRFWDAFACISKAASPASAESVKLAKTGHKPCR